VPLHGHDRVRPAQALRDDHRAARAQGQAVAVGDGGRLHVAGDDGLFPHRLLPERAWPSPSPLLDSETSVETGAASPSRAAFSVCQGSDAHFTRTGNSHTPANTRSLPSSGAELWEAWEGSL